MRTALATVEEAVPDVAIIGARIALRALRPVDPNALIAAMNAVIGNAAAFEDMRAGQLLDVPEASTRDMFAATTIREQPARPLRT